MKKYVMVATLITGFGAAGAALADDDDYRGRGKNADPAGTGAPPANGLFVPGATPVIE